MPDLWIDDPDFPWPNGYPYGRLSERLRAAGLPEVGPETPARAINDLLFDLMGGGRIEPAIRTAWEELRHLDRRLLVDFFLYQLEQGDTTAPEDLPCPVETPDLTALADVPPDFEALIPPAEAPPPLTPLVFREEQLSLPAVDVGELAWNEALILGEDHEQ